MKGDIQQLPPNYVPENPFKPGTPASIRSLPLGDDPTKARIDPAHTWAIVGIGKDLYGSAIVLGAKLGIFGEGSLELHLHKAYDDFQQFLVRTGKYSSITDFSYKTLKCGKSFLVLCFMKPILGKTIHIYYTRLHGKRLFKGLYNRCFPRCMLNPYTSRPVQM